MTDVPPPADPKDLLAIGLSSSANGPKPRWTPPAPGELPAIPNLEIGALLGSGGMGAVYRARQTHLDRPVALKILDPGRGADPAFAERFGREARAMARLDHPAIVRLYDYGQTGTWPWLVMELIDGANLREVIRTGKLATAEALRLAPQLCEALAHAHAAGVVHRDLKPENILIDAQGRPHIADFGLAKLADDGSSLTATGQGCGSAVYMAPEQVAGAAAVDHRADIYALGVILYEMLTGALPLGRFAPPSQTAGVDKLLDEVVLRCLEREPGKRWQSAAEVQQALGRPQPRRPAEASDPENVSVDIGWHGIRVNTGKQAVALDADGEATVDALRPSGKLHRTGRWFLVGGVLLAVWLAIGDPVATPTLFRLAWCAAGGLIVGGMSLLLQRWRRLALVGGIAALLAIPYVWHQLASGFWGTGAALVLVGVCLHHALRAFDLHKLARHYPRSPAQRPATATAEAPSSGPWDALTTIASVLAIPLAIWAGNGAGVQQPGKAQPPPAEAPSNSLTVTASAAGRHVVASFSDRLPGGRTWHVRARIRWHDVQGTAMLESWQHFADGGAYFTRTLADSGPMASFTGTSAGWREVVLPFDASATTASLTRVELALVLAGPGTVEIETPTLVEGLPR